MTWVSKQNKQSSLPPTNFLNVELLILTYFTEFLNPLFASWVSWETGWFGDHWDVFLGITSIKMWGKQDWAGGRSWTVNAVYEKPHLGPLCAVKLGSVFRDVLNGGEGVEPSNTPSPRAAHTQDGFSGRFSCHHLPSGTSSPSKWGESDTAVSFCPACILSQLICDCSLTFCHLCPQGLS